MDNWSQVHTKLVSVCPDFPKDSEACRKKWSVIYNDYKEDKALNLKSGESTSKSPGTKRREDMFMEKCMGEIRESGKTLMESLKANEDMKMALLMSMQKTMQKIVDKM